MWFRPSKRANESIARLRQRFGLSARDASPAALATLQALCLERDALAERLVVAETLADRDTLTPTANRRAFMRELHRTMSEVERYALEAAVLYIDLDGFKSINDTHGHAAGDAVLRQVGRLLVESVRESDVVGRIGGDEFAIILNHAPADEARAKARSLAQEIDRASAPHAGVSHRVKASIGVHAIAAVEDPEIALARADEAMYADKYARRLRAQSA
jgi:diguanylate cyclase (GGDEF)-like protein